ncbi:hypothetical protein BKA69DRAFT_566255 [Paraphysoderma sedebokerense]|nr:hypothetical protein BKA69DRAFT_566255 [Paraphysoderma sedebokerense]
METQQEPSTPSPPSQRTGPRSKAQSEHPSDPSNSTTSNTILPEKQPIASPKSRRHVAAVNFLSSIAFGHESMSPQSFSPLQNWGSIPQGRQTTESLQNAGLENVGFPNSPATPYQLASTSQNQQETMPHPLHVSVTELPSVGTPRMETARVLSARDEAATQFLMNISLGDSAIRRKESQLSNMTTANFDPFASNQLPTPGLYGSPSLDSHSKLLRGQLSDGSISIDTKFNSLHRRSQHPSLNLDSTLLSPVTPRPSTMKRVNVIYSSSFNKNRASLIDELSNSAVMFTTSGVYIHFLCQRCPFRRRPRLSF